MSDWGNFAVEVKSNEASRYPSRCKAGRLMDEQGPEAVAAIEGALSNLELPIRAIQRALRDRGHEVSESVLKLHRGKSCACFRGDR